MHTRFRSPLVVMLTLAACGGGSAAPQPDGPALLGVIAGNNQTTRASRDSALPQPVVAQVVRLPNGSVALRVLDAVLPAKAYAQTAVNGIPGQVVCANTPDPIHALRAEVACATSDALGKAYFVFHSDSFAGTARGQIAAALPTGTKITDSVRALVLPGPVRFTETFGGDSAVKAGDTLDVTRLIYSVSDRYHNKVTSYLLRFQRLNVDSTRNDPAPVLGSKAVVRTGDVRLMVVADSVAYPVKIHTVP